MKEIKVVTYKARGGRDYKVASLQIIFNLELPMIEKATLQEMSNLYEREAKKIVSAMINCLPGGLFDAILLEFFSEKKSLLAVPFIEPKKE